MLDGLDQLDLASFSLTRSAGFAEREPPTPEQIRRWLAARDPSWRVDPRRADRLVDTCAGHCANGGSYALQALREAASKLLRRTANGWEFVESAPAIALMRWRLPLGTMHAAAAAADGDDLAGDPPRPAAHQELNSQLEREGAVDGHVHVGTCLPFDGLFQLLVDQTLAGAPEHTGHRSSGGSEFADSDDQAVAPEELLLTAAVVTGVLEEFQASEIDEFGPFLEDFEIEERFKDALNGGTVWQFLHEPHPRQPHQSLRIASAGDYLQDNGRTPAAEDPYVLAAQRKLELLRLALADDCPPGLQRCVEDMLRCEAILHTSLTQGNRAGLSEFLVRSKRLSWLRKGVPKRNRAVIRYGLPHLSRGMRLTGIELRTAEQNDGHTTVEDLASSLDHQLAGYEEALEALAPDRHPKASWPICLIRTPEVTAVTGSQAGVTGERTRFDLRELFNVVGLTADLLLRFPAASRVIPGLDVAGDENAAPSWCFSLLFGEFHRRLAEDSRNQALGPISYRVHAGESFHSPLQGLRRIYEAVRWVIPQNATARIGHGLALAYSTDRLSDESLQDQPSDEAFDDLVWAWWRLRDADEGTNDFLVELLGEAIMKVGEELYGIEEAQSPDDYQAAYRQRFDLNALLRLGFVSHSTTGSRLRLRPTLRLPSDPSVSDRILFAYLTRRSLREPQGGPMIDPAWLNQTVDAIRPLVLQSVRQRNAVIEVCPTSNVVIAGIDDYRRHPVHEWLANELRVTINTDDPGLFSVTLLDEYGYVWSSSSESAANRLKSFEAVQKLSRDLMDSSSDATANLETVREVREAWRQFEADSKRHGVRP